MNSPVLPSFMRLPMDRFKVGILEMGLVVRGAKRQVSNNECGDLEKSETHFLKGGVTGNDRLRFGFITNGFRRICGPSDVRLGHEVIGGGAEDGGAICGAGETGTDGMGAWVGIGD